MPRVRLAFGEETVELEVVAGKLVQPQRRTVPTPIGDVAAAAGRPRAHRAVGNIMRETRDASVPCHRVIAAGGKLGGYGRDLFAKRALLLAEGVLVSGERVRDFAERRWKHPALKIRR